MCVPILTAVTLRTFGSLDLMLYSYCARHIHLHLTSDKTSRRGNGRAHVVAPPVGKEASSEDSMPPHSDTNCGGSDNSSQVFSLGTHLATRVAGKKKGRRPGR